jgi:mono/diheme cytochrome c family protein
MTWIDQGRRGLVGACALLAAGGVAKAEDLRVMATGLGDGNVSGPGIACSHDGGPDCDHAAPAGTSVLLTVAAGPGSTFAGWGGDCPDADPTTPADQCRVVLSAYRSVRARFDPATPIPALTAAQIADVGETRSGIGDYLAAHPEVNTPAKFIAALPVEYRRNWILMPRSESLQTGTARAPRLLLPSIDGVHAFAVTLADATSPSFPGSHHRAVEFMQWDAAKKTFRFHEIALAPVPDLDDVDPATPGLQPRFPGRWRGVHLDPPACAACHSTRNTINRGSSPGTDGIGRSVPVKMKPNWDAYDSWGGMLAFNRDRIYRGSIEAAAFRSLFNPWTWRSNSQARRVIEQLELQPPGVPDGTAARTRRHADDYGTMLTEVVADDRIMRLETGGRDDGRIVFGFDDPGPPTAVEPAPSGPLSATVSYSFDRRAGGPGGTTVVRNDTLVPATPATTPRSQFVTLHAPATPRSDAGRGVLFLDLVSRNANAPRVADELMTHSVATGNHPIDVRALALAIASGCVTATGGADISSVQGISPPLTPAAQAFFDARNGMTFDQVYDDTRRRQQSLPLRKADIQKLSMTRAADPYVFDPDGPGAGGPAEAIDGLIEAYGGATSGIAGGSGGGDLSLARLRQEIFRRPVDRGGPDATVMGGIIVDREVYQEEIAGALALFRYFLEPLGVAVDKWSTSVRGRSRTYTFSASFGAYLAEMYANGPGSLRASLGIPDIPDPTPPDPPSPPSVSCPAIMPLVNATFASLPAPDALPTFTDIQRVLNKGCIECHGGLGYPPYRSYGDTINFAENETPAPGESRLWRSLATVRSLTGAPTCPPSAPACPIGSGTDLSSSYLYQLITDRGALAHPYNPAEPYDAADPDNPADPDVADERCPQGMMPCGGPPLSKTDIETVRRWIIGGRPNTEGEPHIRTVDGARYDFQAAGEFVLLRGEDMELQARHTPVPTAGPLADPNTGLSACVSVNSAVALRAGRNRVTYQPDLSRGGEQKRGAGGLVLRIDGKRVDLGAGPISLSSGGRVLATSAPGGVEVQMPGGTSVVMTPGRWLVDFMNVEVRHARAVEGVMGAVAPGGWLPALADGTLLGPRPSAQSARRKTLYEIFAESWRVSDSDSLFDYEPGLSTHSFRADDWPFPKSGACAPPPIPGAPASPPAKPILAADAKKFCAGVGDRNRRRHCEADVAATGAPVFADVYLQTEQLANRAAPPAARLVSPADNAVVSPGEARFDWVLPKGAEGRRLVVRRCLWTAAELFSLDRCAPAKGADLAQTAAQGLSRSPNAGLRPGTIYRWKVVVEDETGAIAESETRRFEVKSR